MLRTLKYFLNRAYTLLSIGLFIFTYTALKVGAIYYPTDNITNPTCAPGDSGCYVSLLPDQTSNSGSLLFTNGTNPSWTSPSALSWDSVNGRLGVGTATPIAPIHIYGSTTSTVFLESSASQPAKILGIRNTGTQLSPIAPATGSTMFEMGTASWDGTSFGTSRVASIRFVTTEAWTSTANGAGILFSPIPNGTKVPYNTIAITDQGSMILGVNATPTSTPKAKLDVRGSGSTSSTYTAQFNNSTETNNALVIRDDGNIGIGTANPAYQLNIVGSSPNVVLDRYSSDTTPGVFRSRKARGTTSSPTYALANDGLVFLRGAGYNTGVAGFVDTASISIMAGEDYSTTNNRGSYISFATNPNNNSLTSSGGFERMRLSDLGNLGIGSYTKLSKLTVTAPTDTSDIGGTTTVNASTTINGVGTLFTTSLGIGDRISLSSTPGTYATVTAIASDTSLTVDTALGNGTSQTINLKKSVFRIDDNSGNTRLLLNDQGTLLVGTASDRPYSIYGNNTSVSSRKLVVYSSTNTPTTFIYTGNGGSMLDLSTPNAIVSHNQGSNINWQSLSSDNTTKQYARITTYFRDKTAGSERADFSIVNMQNGYMTDQMRFTGWGNVSVGSIATSYSGQTISKLSKFTITNSADVTDIGGTASSSGTTITGTGTNFLWQLGIGDRISLSGAPSTYATVTAIASSTSLTTDVALGVGAGQTINVKKSIFRVDDASNVTKFLIQDDGSTSINSIITNPFGFGGGSFLFEGKVSNQPGNIIAMGNNLGGSNPIGRFIFGHHYGTTYTRVADIVANRASADDAADLIISTKPTGGALTARVTISSTGVLTFSPLTSCGGLQTNGSGTLSCTSDERLKDIQGDFTKGLEAIRNINPKAFSWKQDSNLYDNGLIYNGFIAQNIQSALPEAVSISSDGIHLQVSQLTLLAASINAIKELDIKVNQLSSLDTTLQGSFAFLLKEVLGNVSNGINELYVKVVKSDRVETKEFCTSTGNCLNEDELNILIQEFKNNHSVQQPQVVNIDNDLSEEIIPTPITEPIIEEIVQEDIVE